MISSSGFGWHFHTDQSPCKCLEGPGHIVQHDGPVALRTSVLDRRHAAQEVLDQLERRRRCEQHLFGEVSRNGTPDILQIPLPLHIRTRSHHEHATTGFQVPCGRPRRASRPKGRGGRWLDITQSAAAARGLPTGRMKRQLWTNLPKYRISRGPNAERASSSPGDNKRPNAPHPSNPARPRFGHGRRRTRRCDSCTIHPDSTPPQVVSRGAVSRPATKIHNIGPRQAETGEFAERRK